jgi:hypothetical protein
MGFDGPFRLSGVKKRHAGRLTPFDSLDKTLYHTCNNKVENVLACLQYKLTTMGRVVADRRQARQ